MLRIRAQIDQQAQFVAQGSEVLEVSLDFREFTVRQFAYVLSDVLAIVRISNN